jgi:hypothetical protein
MYIHTFVCTYIHTYVHAYIRMYIHTYVCTYIHICTYIHTYVHTYIRIPYSDPFPHAAPGAARLSGGKNDYSRRLPTSLRGHALHQVPRQSRPLIYAPVALPCGTSAAPTTAVSGEGGGGVGGKGVGGREVETLDVCAWVCGMFGVCVCVCVCMCMCMCVCVFSPVHNHSESSPN